MSLIPVLTIDGPSGAGKGTVAQQLADTLGWHYLDSGAIYRVLAYLAMQRTTPVDDEEKLSELATNLDMRCTTDVPPKILLEDQDVTDSIRSPDCSQIASKISALPSVRQALLMRQRAFRTAPGLVTDGRDMGTVVFPDAICKVFLTATPEERANRRYLQLQDNNIAANLSALIESIRERDERDANRAISPTIAAYDALTIDTTPLSVNQVCEQILVALGAKLQK